MSSDTFYFPFRTAPEYDATDNVILKYSRSMRWIVIILLFLTSIGGTLLSRSVRWQFTPIASGSSLCRGSIGLLPRQPVRLPQLLRLIIPPSLRAERFAGSCRVSRLLRHQNCQRTARH